VVPGIKRILTLKFRRQRRYKVREGIYVAYEQSLFKNQVDSISLGGLSFYYVDDGTKIEKGSYQLALFSKSRLFLGNVPFKTVSDIATGELIFRSKKIKRQSVRFMHLSPPQKSRLKEIIQNFAVK
jgi:hypothetical protein